MDKKPPESGSMKDKKPWPIGYVIAAILLFALIFNLWLIFGGQ